MRGPGFGLGFFVSYGLTGAEYLSTISHETINLKMSPYTIRDSILRSMGYKSYADYLSSDRWKKIRASIFKLYDGKCAKCSGLGCDVHHLAYDTLTMYGHLSRIKNLILLCRSCHESIEFDCGAKCTLDEANSRLGIAPKNLNMSALGRKKDGPDEFIKMKSKGMPANTPDTPTENEYEYKKVGQVKIWGLRKPGYCAKTHSAEKRKRKEAKKSQRKF